MSCSSEGYCVKNCVCAAETLCTPSTLADGCPPQSRCVVLDVTSEGTCIAECDDQVACPPGQKSCAASPADVSLCVGEGFAWVAPDGGS